MITSAANSQIREIEKLQKKSKHRKETGVFVVEGKKMVLEAGGLLIKAYMSESYFNSGKNTGLENGDYEIVADQIFKGISETVAPQGILGLVRMPEYSLEELLEGSSQRLLLLENLRDPGNLGTIIRTAEGAGMTGVILSRESVDVFNPKVIRSTMGSVYRVPFLYTGDFYGTLQLLKQRGIVLYAAHLQGEREYDQEIYEEKTGILIGNEASGLTNEASQAADHLVRIPMEGQVESLNAAIASTVFMYEIYRQRRRGK